MQIYRNFVSQTKQHMFANCSRDVREMFVKFVNMFANLKSVRLESRSSTASSRTKKAFANFTNTCSWTNLGSGAMSVSASRTLSPLPFALLCFNLLQVSIRCFEWFCCSVKASISIVDIRMTHPRCSVFNLLRRLFFIRLKLENPRSQSTLVAGRTAIIRHKLQLNRM